MPSAILCLKRCTNAVTCAGSHKEGQPRRRFVRDANGKLDFDKPSDDFDLSEFVPLECKVCFSDSIKGIFLRE